MAIDAGRAGDAPVETVIAGRVLEFRENPFESDPATSVAEHGAVAIGGGTIVATGNAGRLRRDHPAAEFVDHGDRLVLAGFVDAHVHYPQTRIVASWGKRLIDWLNDYTFPEEARFGDANLAAAVAARYLDLATANGTTSVCSFCTIHPESVDAFFREAESRGQRVVAGRTCMDRNAPDGLRDDARSAHDESEALLSRWHGKGRAIYAITPRFSPTSSPEQLEALGALWARHPDCPMQTHLSEQTEEVAWVRDLFPDARDYLDTYERYGLLGPGAVFGHAIHLEPRERDRIRETDAGLAHCPTSNAFIGSGLFDTAGLAAEGQRIGLGTDTGGGSSFSMLRTMASAYEIGQLRGSALHPAQLLWLATVGSARVLRLDGKIGNLSTGLEADIVVIDPMSTDAIAQRAERAESLWEAVFPTIMMGDDRAIAEVWIGGRRTLAR